jgi:hypothetical protein
MPVVHLMPRPSTHSGCGPLSWSLVGWTAWEGRGIQVLPGSASLLYMVLLGFANGWIDRWMHGC